MCYFQESVPEGSNQEGTTPHLVKTKSKVLPVKIVDKPDGVIPKLSPAGAKLVEEFRKFSCNSVSVHCLRQEEGDCNGGSEVIRLLSESKYGVFL